MSLQVRANHGGISRAGAYPSLVGNDGASGPWLPQAPAAGKAVIAVGSVDKLVTEPPSRNPSDHRLASTAMLIENATVFINGQEGVPVVSPWSPWFPLFLTRGYQPYYSITPAINDSTPLEMYATSSNTSVVGDACDPLPDTTPDLSNKVVVIRRGVCPFAQKCQNAEKFGAKLFLFYKWVLSSCSLRVWNS